MLQFMFWRQTRAVLQLHSYLLPWPTPCSDRLTTCLTMQQHFGKAVSNALL
jgi:hypothetical protein